MSYNWDTVGAVDISGYHGGKSRGMCLQLSIDGEGIAGLDVEEVRALVASLTRWLNEKYRAPGEGV